MSEHTPAYIELLESLRPVFVTCTAGTNAFTDCMVTMGRNAVLVNGHTEMLFNKAEATAFGQAVLKFAERL